MGLRFVYQLRENVRELIRVRGVQQNDITFALKKDPTWLSKFLQGQRPIHITDIDALAEFFGLSGYQLCQPGITAVTERRRQERRSGGERRIGHVKRHLVKVADEVQRAHPRQVTSDQQETDATAHLHRQLRTKLAEVVALLAETESGGQTPVARTPVPATSRRGRTAGGPDAKKPA